MGNSKTKVGVYRHQDRKHNGLPYDTLPLHWFSNRFKGEKEGSNEGQAKVVADKLC